jgi:hypothetical protein
LSQSLAVVFSNVPAGVQLLNASGTDAEGNPYLNLANAIDGDGLGMLELSSAIELVFSDPDLLRLALQVRVYGEEDEG